MRFVTAAAAIFLSLAIVDAQDEPPPPMGDDAPHVVLGPPEGFEPPDHPAMPEDSAEAHEMALDLFFHFMDANGNGEIDNGEFKAWVRHFHMPAHDGEVHPEGDMPPEGEPPHDDGMTHPDDGTMHDDGMMDPDGEMMGVSSGDPGTEGKPEPMMCSDELRDGELGPQAEGVSCPHSESVGNVVFRTVCNLDPWRSQAISLPAGRAADCFGLEAIAGHHIEFEIIREADGSQAFHTSMGKEAFDNLVLTEDIYHINLLSADEPDARITVKFIDHPMF